jgi:hypothetical protein
LVHEIDVLKRPVPRTDQPAPRRPRSGAEAGRRTSAKRGDRAAPPPHPGGYTIRFATNDAAKGWEELKGQLAVDSYGGKTLPQWQYEVTSGGRIWYLVDHDTRTCWIKEAGSGHPKRPNDTALSAEWSVGLQLIVTAPS